MCTKIHIPYLFILVLKFFIRYAKKRTDLEGI